MYISGGILIAIALVVILIISFYKQKNNEEKKKNEALLEQQKREAEQKKRTDEIEEKHREQKEIALSSICYVLKKYNEPCSRYDALKLYDESENVDLSFDSLAGVDDDGEECTIEVKPNEAWERCYLYLKNRNLIQQRIANSIEKNFPDFKYKGTYLTDFEASYLPSFKKIPPSQNEIEKFVKSSSFLRDTILDLFEGEDDEIECLEPESKDLHFPESIDREELRRYCAKRTTTKTSNLNRENLIKMDDMFDFYFESENDEDYAESRKIDTWILTKYSDSIRLTSSNCCGDLRVVHHGDTGKWLNDSYGFDNKSFLNDCCITCGSDLAIALNEIGEDVAVDYINIYQNALYELPWSLCHPNKLGKGYYWAYDFLGLLIMLSYKKLLGADSTNFDLKKDKNWEKRITSNEFLKIKNDVVKRILCFCINAEDILNLFNSLLDKMEKEKGVKLESRDFSIEFIALYPYKDFDESKAETLFLPYLERYFF